MAWTLDQKLATRAAIIEECLAKIEDPNRWNTWLRRLAERVGLKVERLQFHPALKDTVFWLAKEAEDQGMTPRQLAEAAHAIEL
jgi:hypothetical protein